MQLCMFLYPVTALLGRSEIFGLALASVDLLGVGQRGRFSSHIFLVVSITVGYLSYWGVLVLKGVIEHLGYFISWDYHLYPIRTVS